ncbi:MAG: alkaline phosphatase family protein [Clostridia bacterium]|nr:alkaline phosphatase family protein [Clostridia bacterium]
MKDKVILVLVDGMRPDGLLQCSHPFVERMKKLAAYSLTAQTVMPSVTLPCHMSLFHSVDPERHGITTNTYIPQVRPIEGLFDRLDAEGKKCGFFYTWEELRDLSRPDHLHTAVCMNQHKRQGTDNLITDAAIKYINDEDPDFLFLYLGETDELGGHDTGWMSETYLKVVNNAIGCTEKLYDSISKDYTLILTADHGGHGRGHGSDDPQDMTIPIFIIGPRFEKGKEYPGGSIKDIAPTVTKLLEVRPAKEWEGKPMI